MVVLLLNERLRLPDVLSRALAGVSWGEIICCAPLLGMQAEVWRHTGFLLFLLARAGCWSLELRKAVMYMEEPVTLVLPKLHTLMVLQSRLGDRTSLCFIKCFCDTWRQTLSLGGAAKCSSST